MKRIQIIISGRVQGVWFRHNTNIAGNKLGLKGFVRNLPDGNVEVIAEGNEEKIQQMINFCKTGPEGSYVEDVKIKYEKPKSEFKTFSIRY